MGGYALNNDYLKMLGIDQMVFVGMIISGSFFMVTAAIGVTAAYSRNECLAFFVSSSLAH
jgi:hypothetical protein